MLAVADTSPLHYLILIHQETLLPTLYARVVIPPAVYGELLRSETPEVVRQWLAQPPGWLTIQPPHMVWTPRPIRNWALANVKPFL